jgi:RNA polymerase sigma-70 factor (ECF subfamily)
MRNPFGRTLVVFSVSTLVVDPEADLVARCLQGDARAESEFWELFQRRVFALCLRMLGHRQDAEDVTQESLWRALRYLKGWDPERRLTPWVLKIAANRCRTALLRRSQLPAVQESLPEPQVAAAEVGDLPEAVNQALAGMRENYRRCFILFYQQELSVAEVAEVLEVPEGTVKTWLFRARKELADFLRERGFAPEGH